MKFGGFGQDLLLGHRMLMTLGFVTSVFCFSPFLRVVLVVPFYVFNYFKKRIISKNYWIENQELIPVVFSVVLKFHD